MPKQWADIPIVNVFTWISRLREADQLSDWGYHRMKGCRKPRVGDMAVFNSPEYPHPLLVKRIASIIDAGATITVTSDNYEMMKHLIENEGHTAYLRGSIIVIDGRRDSTVVLKQPYYFMRGDNRDNSRDSRVFGFVPETAIVGKMNFVFYSIDNEKKGLNKFRMNKFFRVID
jgi:signal peptidase I